MEIIKIKSESLAQLSYLIIDGDKAAVIDPRRDAEIYFNKAQAKGAVIKYIFETHRNEDFVTGSRELKRYCEAEIYHGEGLPFEFGKFVKDGDEFELADAHLKVLKTPGHTPESISIVLYPSCDAEKALAVFTGDALFVSDVGRTDFFPDQLNEFAAMLYESIHDKILPLGDQVVLYPAHGAGSVCGGGIADRELSTLGFERRHNPMLQLSKDEFIKKKANETHQMPPYFRQMEEVNLKGSDTELKNYSQLDSISVAELKDNFKDYQVIDIRSAEAFLGCHVPNSLSIPADMLSSYGGYFLNYQDPIVLIGEGLNEIKSAQSDLLNLGYDNVRAMLKGGIIAWEVSGEVLSNGDMVDAHRVLNKKSKMTLLDVRKPSEWEEGLISNARTIFLGDLLGSIGEFKADESIVTYCGSGKRATIAASILQANGFSKVSVFMGSMKSYNAITE